MIITIDGLAVNGKTTLAGMISKELNFKNFNTGAIYRCITLEIIEQKLDINNIEEIIEQLKNIDVNFENEKIILNGSDVSNKIYTEEISLYSTKWATIKEIKEFVRKMQKEFINKYDTVIEGRDIATRIAPNADIKFYLYSDFEVRVNRLWMKNQKIDKEVTRNKLMERDSWEINSKDFIKPQNAIEIETSDKNINEVFEIMMEKIKTYINNK